MARYRSGSISIDVGLILDEVSDEDLIAEMESRGLSTEGREASPHPDVPKKLTLSSWDAESLKEAICHDDGRRAIDVLKAVLQ